MNMLLLSKLAAVRSIPCVTIALNTHTTHPDTLQDIIVFKNLVNEALSRLDREYPNVDSSSFHHALEHISNSIDFNHNRKSLHIFVSDELAEVIRSPQSIPYDGVIISDRFEVEPLMAYQESQISYLVMVLSQSGVSLYEASNGTLVREITEDGFPISENPYYVKTMEDRSESALVDRMTMNFMNEVDNALIKVYHRTNLPCVVISTERNFSMLSKAAHKSTIYLGYSPINYNDLSALTIASQSWETVKRVMNSAEFIDHSS
jgi:hypothetical protein